MMMPALLALGGVMQPIRPSLALLALVTVSVAGCGATEAGFRQSMDRLIGMPKPVLVAVLGPPFREQPSSNGGVVATYDQSWVQTGGGYMGIEPKIAYVDGTTYDRRGKARGSYHETRTTYVDRWVPPYSKDRVCFVDFEMDPEGRAVLYRYSGDGCVARAE
jgi:hypothetical protein